MLDKASATAHHCVSDATCRELLELVIASASMSDDALSGRMADAIEALTQVDEDLRAWVANVRASVQRSALDQVNGLFGPETLPASRLPECILQFGLRCRDAQLERLLHQVAHLAVRLRGTETSFAARLHDAKTEAVYNFAYGLSHELNNPLANIATRAGVLARDETDPARRTLLDSIVDSAMRGCEMLGDLMLVARPPEMKQTEVPVDAFTESLVADIQTWTKRYSIEVDCQVDYVGSLYVDPVAMREALWTIARNSIEAMHSGGQLILSVRRSAEDRMQFEIRDTGPGLSPTALRHCFDPYYSGREAGRGLGLGLSKAQRIVQLHGGTVGVANLPGRGCSVTVELPC